MRFGPFSSPAPNVRFCIKNYIKCVLDGVTPPIFSFQLEWGPRTFSARLFYGVTPLIKVRARGGVITHPLTRITGRRGSGRQGGTRAVHAATIVATGG